MGIGIRLMIRQWNKPEFTLGQIFQSMYIFYSTKELLIDMILWFPSISPLFVPFFAPSKLCCSLLFLHIMIDYKKLFEGSREQNLKLKARVA